ncbi:MAG TPA: hypothetical protein VNO24_09770 [Blastocatellia bacterium]|nr:hypothetical protein [Blastocatellia bacterium]
MRHDLMTLAVTTDPGRVSKASAVGLAGSIGPASRWFSGAIRVPLDGAIAMSAVAMYAATRAQEHTARSLHRRSP